MKQASQRHPLWQGINFLQHRQPSGSWQWRRIPWGLAWGVGWGTLLCLTSSGPLLYRLESDARQALFRLRGSQTVAPEVVVVGIDGKIEGSNQTIDFLLDRANYAGLTLKLLQAAQAKVVVLNLPSSFVVPQTLGNEDLDAPLRQLVQQYPDQLVLATRSSESFRQAEISIYNQFLPFSSLLLEYLVPPEEVQGVVQYRLDAAGVLRQAYLWGNYIRRDSQTLQGFASVEALAIAKLDRERARQLFRPGRQRLEFNPLEAEAGIPILPIEALCPPPPINNCSDPQTEQVLDPDLKRQLQGKIVLVGFVDGYTETFPVRIANGRQVAAVELQAQIISSLLQGTQYHSIPVGLSWLVIELSAILTGVSLAANGQRLRLRWRHLIGQQRLMWPLAALLVYLAWAVAQFFFWRQIWPLTLPFLACGFTMLSVVLALVLLQNRDRLIAQQLELEQLRRVEQEAITDQARKLLYRVATDIHDQELQELKLVMDALESWQWQQTQGQPPDLSQYDPLLAQLEGIGQGIRDQLNDVRTLASKLSISPTLREGLHQGMDHYLNGLIEVGMLTLPLKRHLQPLQEAPTSEWLDAREDIMRFLREAMANVIGHVQPPKGTATFVEVKLTQRQHHCQLLVINDGVELATTRRGGYGSKAMNTIASYLPKGSWQRTLLPNHLTCVELHWEMPEIPSGDPPTDF
ncbi:MAG: CHASE2 domain-containing protein [Cyanobacteriota bacterium]|nr:CHASE2 domain-containing protein [Cyanobacteriota bacterium]